MQILKKTESINWAIEALDDMPGIGRKSAEQILAETVWKWSTFKMNPVSAHGRGLCLSVRKEPEKR